MKRPEFITLLALGMGLLIPGTASGTEWHPVGRVADCVYVATYTVREHRHGETQPTQYSVAAVGACRSYGARQFQILNADGTPWNSNDIISNVIIRYWAGHRCLTVPAAPVVGLPSGALTFEPCKYTTPERTSPEAFRQVFQKQNAAMGGVILKNFYDQTVSGGSVKCIEKSSDPKYPALAACTNSVDWTWSPNREY